MIADALFILGGAGVLWLADWGWRSAVQAWRERRRRADQRRRHFARGLVGRRRAGSHNGARWT